LRLKALAQSDFQKAEELKEFYNRRGKNDSAWDWTNMHE